VWFGRRGKVVGSLWRGPPRERGSPPPSPNATNAEHTRKTNALRATKATLRPHTTHIGQPRAARACVTIAVNAAASSCSTPSSVTVPSPSTAARGTVTRVAPDARTSALT
jgi:hypothetical protein